jgi:transmembrane sensor
MSSRPQRPEDIDAVAAHWIARRDAGLAADEIAALAAWRDADPRHASALARFDSTWAVLSRPRHTDGARSLQREVTALRRRRDRQRWRLAAGTALLVCGGLAVAPLLPPRTEVEPEPRVGHVTQPDRRLLPDGSTALFKRGAGFSVHFDASSRRIRLEHGKAHFEVRPQPDRPFIVEAGTVSVRAVGTAFAVHLEAGSVDVVVTHGQVSVSSAGSSSRAVLAAAGQLVAVPAAPSRDDLRATSLPAGEVERRLAWRRPQVEFSGTPLTAVLATVNRLTPENGPRLVIADPALGRVPLSGRFRVDDAPTLGRLLATALGLVAEVRDDRTLVLRSRRPEDGLRAPGP